MVADIDVDLRGKALQGCRILLGISGGIAAVESVRLGRELRRYGASLHIIMTDASRKIISPLAVGWATRAEITTGWSSAMPQLGQFDGILISPATRNILAKYQNGILDSPLLMALSSARKNKTPVLFIPSMHDDLFDDPVTQHLIDDIQGSGDIMIYENSTEGRRKQPSSEKIVEKLCHIVNGQKPNRKNVIITLGGNSAKIDDVREVRSGSTGTTGFTIANQLYRSGHQVTCIVGTNKIESLLSNIEIISAESHSEMRAAIETCSLQKPDAWILSAAVLDYLPRTFEGKIESGRDRLEINLYPSEKLIDTIKILSPNSLLIGFKLESGIDDSDLITKAREQIERTGSHAVVANHFRALEGVGPRAFLVTKQDILELVDEIAIAEELDILLQHIEAK
jgi:phosphopantothenoylcysteine decarboxylase/phosphopantothenate--cysteine ligase